jgi:hypothetical protein
LGDARWDRRSAALITSLTALINYLTTDLRVLGILAWASIVITLLGFWAAIWQIKKVKRAADAARDASLGMVQRVHSRELLAKLGDAHRHLVAALNRTASDEREFAIFCLVLSSGCMIEAQEMSRTLGQSSRQYQPLVLILRDSIQQLTTMTDPLRNHPDIIRLQLQMRKAEELLQQYSAPARYAYERGGE